ncbi:MAG TPA: hypothetical protein VGF24_08295 [Vicinamibacterales bacterium]
MIAALALVVRAITLLDAQEPRRIVRTSEQPLATYLRPGDRHVIIESPNPRPQRLSPDPGETRAHLLAGASDAVLAIRVERVRGVPVRRMETHPDALEYKTWFEPASDDEANRILSTISARVEDVFKGSYRFKKGEELIFEDGYATETYGTATIHGVTVEYRIPWLRALVAGKRYLLFGSFGDAEIFFRHEAYEEPEPGSELVRTYLDHEVRPRDEFELLTLSNALSHVVNEMRK